MLSGIGRSSYTANRARKTVRESTNYSPPESDHKSIANAVTPPAAHALTALSPLKILARSHATSIATPTAAAATPVDGLVLSPNLTKATATQSPTTTPKTIPTPTTTTLRRRSRASDSRARCAKATTIISLSSPSLRAPNVCAGAKPPQAATSSWSPSAAWRAMAPSMKPSRRSQDLHRNTIEQCRCSGSPRRLPSSSLRWRSSAAAAATIRAGPPRCRSWALAAATKSHALVSRSRSARSPPPVWTTRTGHSACSSSSRPWQEEASRI